MTVNLNFDRTLPAWDALHLPLIFGVDLGDRPITIEATLPGLVSTIRVGVGVRATISVTLGQLVGSIGIDNDINVWRGIAVSAAGDWQQGAARSGGSRSAWEQSISAPASAVTPWQRGAARDHSQRSTFAPMPRLRDVRAHPWERGASLGDSRGGRYGYVPPLHLLDVLRWDRATGIGRSAGSRYTHPPHLRDARVLPWGELADLQRALGGSFERLGRRLLLRYVHPWQLARQPPPGLSVWVPPVDPTPEPFIPSTDLVFCWPAKVAENGLWHLVFGLPTCPTGSIVVPIRRVYFVQNTATLVRVSDGAEIPASQLGLAIDADSWGWELRATIAGRTALDLIKRTDGEPVEIDALVNGSTWRVLVDSWTDNRSFGGGSYTITGRSEAAYLGRPYATPRDYTETQIRTAQQLMAQELPIDWSLDFQMTDWLVPADVWSYQRLTPMEAIARVAAAAGGYVQATPNTKTLRVLPRYPVAPWNWGSETPGLILPLAVVTETGTDWQPQDEANGVYVSGETGDGVLVHVVRDGTAGNLQAPMVVDRLITEVAAGRNRGIAELAQRRRHSLHRIQLPLAADLGGLVQTGTLLEQTGDGTAWRGLVRGVSITAGRNTSGLTVRQELTVERHY